MRRTRDRPAPGGRRCAPVVYLLGVLIGVAGLPPAAAAEDTEPSPTCGVFIAHRGEHSRWTEDTKRAMEAAVDVGADYVEVDVRETKDHALILMHDATVDRTTKGSGSVAEMTLDRLEKVTLNDGTRITSLSQDLRAIEDSSIKVMLEIKSIKSDEGFTLLAQRVREIGVDRVVVTAFKAHLLDSMREVAPEVALSLITAGSPTVDQGVAYGSVSVYYPRIRRHWLRRMRRDGYPVYAWTLNAKASWARWNGRVSAITTDEAIRFSKWRKKADCPEIPTA